MDERYEYVCRVQTPEGERDYVTLLAPESFFPRGLVPESIVGVLSHPLKSGEPITPEIFARNRVFVDFLHEVIARHAPSQAAFQAEARRLGNGWVYVIDQRTPTPEGPVPPEDILGGFEVKNGEVVPGSYRRSPNHRLCNAFGPRNGLPRGATYSTHLQRIRLSATQSSLPF